MKTLKDLLVSMINATLILVAICLFFLWRLSDSAERVVASFAQNLQIVAPLENSVDRLRDEVATLRSDLASISLDSSALTAQATANLQSRADAVQRELEGINNSLARLADTPETLMQTALDDVATRVSGRIGAVASCYAPDPTPDASSPSD
jgi:DNA anti-recombination protein RmuC